MASDLSCFVSSGIDAKAAGNELQQVFPVLLVEPKVDDGIHQTVGVEQDD